MTIALSRFMLGKEHLLLSIRLEPDLKDLLPTERGERSRIAKEGLMTYLCPPEPQDEMTMIKASWLSCRGRFFFREARLTTVWADSLKC
jgi:hypothetical protein